MRLTLKAVHMAATFVRHRNWWLKTIGNRSIDYCFVVPALGLTAAEVYILGLCQQIKKRKKTARIVILEFDSPQEVWIKKEIRRYAEVFNLSRAEERIEAQHVRNLYRRVFSELLIKRVIVIGGQMPWVHGDRSFPSVPGRKWYGFFFCEKDQKSKNAKMKEWVLRFSRKEKVYPLTDNRLTQRRLSQLYGQKRVTLLSPPLLATKTKQKRLKNQHSVQILWASRVETQKNPELLVSIARIARTRFPHAVFHVYGRAGSKTGSHALRALRRLSNVRLYGAYEGFRTIPAQSYDLFLYTSRYDGKPLVILEAMSAGLPVVCSGVGGIPEVATSSNSGIVPVAKSKQALAYIEKIEELISSPKRAQAVSKKAKRDIAQKFSAREFARSVARIPGFY